MKIDSVHAEFMSGNAVSSTTSSHSIVARDASGDIAVAGVSIVGNSGTLFRYGDGTSNVYGGCNNSEPWFGTSSENDLRLVTDGSERMRIDKTGNVGIGTSSPSTYLHLYANNSDPGATEGDLIGTHNLTEYLRFTSEGDSGDVNSVSVGFKVGADDNDNVNPDGRLDICANNGAGVGNNYGTTPDKTIATFIGSGNVGIGTTGPDEKLHVNGNIRIGGATGVNDNNDYYIKSTGQLFIRANDADLDNGHVCGGMSAGVSNVSSIVLCGANTSTNYQMVYFKTRNTERMRIDKDGNVGIGTNDPDKELHVYGSIKCHNTGSTGDEEGLFLHSSGDWYNFSPGNDGYLHLLGGASNQGHMSGNFTSMKLANLLTYGNVGIGTNSADTRLHIYQSAGSANLVDKRTNKSTGDFNQHINYTHYASVAEGANRNPDNARGLWVGNMVDENDASPSGANFMAFTNSFTFYGVDDQTKWDSSLSFTSNTDDLKYSGGTFSKCVHIDADGSVGVGTTSPAYKLDVHGSANVGALTATTISGPLTGNASTASKFASNVQIGGVNFDGSGSIDLPGVNSLGNQHTSGNAETSNTAANANTVGGLGIGSFLRTDQNTECEYQLNVTGYVNESINDQRYFIANTVSHANYSLSEDQTYWYWTSIKATYWIRGEGLLATSDERVKTDIQTLDTGMALSKLEKIRPVSYKMKNAGEFMFGFIGQEIEKELPNVVAKDTGYISDFNIMGVFSNKQSIKYQGKDEEKDVFVYTLTLDVPIPSTFDVNRSTYIEASCVSEGSTAEFFYNPEYCGKPEIGGTVMKLLSEKDNVKEGVSYKIIGTLVNDLRSLDYNEIFTVTTAALKEVNEQLQAEKIKTADLTTRLTELEGMVSLIKHNMTWPDA